MRLLTAKEVAPILQVTPARVYELARKQLVPSVRLNRQVRFDEDALREFVARGGSQMSSNENQQVARA